MVTRVGGVYLGVSYASHPKGAEFQGWAILEVLLYLCRHHLTQNYQIRYGNTWGRVFRSATLHLHKCVARFVSDSWVSCLNYRPRTKGPKPITS